ncbi:MAG: hypothetical protein HUJ25_01515 [Crocinitomicaceae bacterium]|nr:hypothetical protein [Crocinitomicaceae bacterium]
MLYDLPIITHGFSESKYNSATVQTFEKGSNFETNHLKQFGIQLDKYSDIARQTRTFSLPKEVTTAYDLKIIFSGDLEYKITEMTVDWEENWYIEEGYECNLIAYKLNGKLDSRGSNIIINEPNYRFD